MKCSFLCILVHVVTSLSLAIAKPELSLVQVEGLRVGKTNREEILKTFGRPDRVFEPEQTQGQGQVWAYLSGSVQSVGRLSVSFPAHSDVVDSISWDIRDGDPEKNLETALAHFKDATFVKSRPKTWNNPHVSPDEVYYEDAKSGLTIVYFQTPKRVSTISWTVPDRGPTSQDEAMKPSSIPFCIDGVCAKMSE